MRRRLEGWERVGFGQSFRRTVGIGEETRFDDVPRKSIPHHSPSRTASFVRPDLDRDPSASKIAEPLASRADTRIPSLGKIRFVDSRKVYDKSSYPNALRGSRERARARAWMWRTRVLSVLSDSSAGRYVEGNLPRRLQALWVVSPEVRRKKTYESVRESLNRDTCPLGISKFRMCEIQGNFSTNFPWTSRQLPSYFNRGI